MSLRGKNLIVGILAVALCVMVWRLGPVNVQMTNALDPQKGYILHLQKIEETNSTYSVK